MTNEDKVIAEAEGILAQFADELTKKQIAEHQRSMPFLSAITKQMVLAEHDEYDPTNSIHLFVIREASPDEVGGEVINPLQIDASEEDKTVAQLRHIKGFADSSVAVMCLRDSNAAIAFCEAMTGESYATFMAINDTTFALYAARKLTVSKRTGAGDFVTHTADLTKGDETPDTFFAKVGLADKDIMPITAMMFFSETGEMMRKDMPEVYNLLAKRIREKIQGGEEDNGES